MRYRDEDIQRQLRLGEDSHWEFKQVVFAGNRLTSPRRHDLADEIAAFANAEGGVLLCGVTDQGDVQSLSRDELVALDAFLVETSTDFHQAGSAYSHPSRPTPGRQQSVGGSHSGRRSTA